MAVPRASSGELIDVRPLADGLRNVTTKALFKTDRIEVFRMVLQAGKETPSHHVPGPVTIQCLEGSVELTLAAGRHAMRAGHMVGLAGGEVHALKALEDASVLVTIVLKGA